MAGHTDARALTGWLPVGGEAGGGARRRRGLGWGCGDPSRRPIPARWASGGPAATWPGAARSMPSSLVPVGLRCATSGPGAWGGGGFWGLLPSRWGSDGGGPSGGDGVAVHCIMVMGVTLSVWTPREL